MSGSVGATRGLLLFSLRPYCYRQNPFDAFGRSLVSGLGACRKLGLYTSVRPLSWLSSAKLAGTNPMWPVSAAT